LEFFETRNARLASSDVVRRLPTQPDKHADETNDVTMVRIVFLNVTDIKSNPIDPSHEQNPPLSA
jgi:hypothetical protein